MPTELTRDQIINLISPSSKNSEHHDLAFANRVIDAMRDLTQRPAAQTEREAFDCGLMPLIEDYAKAVHDGDDALCQVLRQTIEASLPAPQQATPTRATREAEQRARMQARLATRHEGKATADFDLPPPNDAIQQATPEPVGESALARYKFLNIEGEESCPVERLRGFLSLALSGQDWLDVEPFLDALTRPAPGVPEGWSIHTDAHGSGEYWLRDAQGTLIARHMRKETAETLASVLAAAQAKGGEHA